MTPNTDTFYAVFLSETFLGLNGSPDLDINYFQTVSTETTKYLDLESSITELKSLSEKLFLNSTLYKKNKYKKYLGTC